MQINDAKLLKRLEQRMEELRRQLDEALANSGGNLEDETVLRIAAEFDRVLSEYLKASARRT